MASNSASSGSSWRASPEAVTRPTDCQQVLDVALGVDRRTPLHGPEHREAGHEHGHETDREELATASRLATLGGDRPMLAVLHLPRLAIALGDAAGEERPFRAGQLHRRHRRPTRASDRADRRARGTRRRGRRRPTRASPRQVAVASARRPVRHRSSSAASSTRSATPRARSPRSGSSSRDPGRS